MPGHTGSSGRGKACPQAIPAVRRPAPHARTPRAVCRTRSPATHRPQSKRRPPVPGNPAAASAPPPARRQRPPSPAGARVCHCTPPSRVASACCCSNRETAEPAGTALRDEGALIAGDELDWDRRWDAGRQCLLKLLVRRRAFAVTCPPPTHTHTRVGGSDNRVTIWLT